MTGPSIPNLEGTAAPLALAVAAAVLSGSMIVVLRPLLRRYALARPNARSAHVEPVPQGGGIAVLGAALLVTTLGGALMALDSASWFRLGLLASGACLVAIVGLVDDLRPLPPLPRLALQLLAMALAVMALPEGARVLPLVPVPIERVLLVIGGAWFINLTNFMDGMDWMTVAETVPMTAALALFWHWGKLSAPAGLIAIALCGGLVGFAPFNRPVAKLFLGDVGSLPIGLLVAFCLFDLASHGGLAAAILLPLYYLADSGITLVWRFRRGERVWEAHRQHFYQVAVARGFTVRDVVLRVLAVNVGLALFATASVLEGSPGMVLVDLALGAWIVFRLLRDLARGRTGVAA
jgi:UDP-N-acetylmuramyl pentapeptide phosphotransferase/UDP-N-acetylglucosamine-1-phosphate transferase